MTLLTTSTIIAVILVAAVSAIIGQRRKARQQDDNDSLETGKKHAQQQKLLIDKTLRLINCNPKWEYNKEKWAAEYDFQNGHFRIYINEKSPFVSVYYLYFYTTGTDNLHLIRSLCNMTNFHTEMAKITYTVDDERNEIDVHYMGDIFVQKDNAKAVLLRSMMDAFQWQTAFVRKFEDQLRERKEADDQDLELGNHEYNREMFLLRQQEMYRQKAGEVRTTLTGTLALGDLLDKAADINDISVAQMFVYSDSHADDCSVVGLDYDIREAMCPADGSVCHNMIINLLYTDPHWPDIYQRLTVNVNKLGDDKMTLWFRATVCVVPVNPESDVAVRDAKACNVTFAVDKAAQQQRLAEFRYMWLDAQDKARDGKFDEMTEEQKLICFIKQPELSQKLYMGRKLFLAQRYYEALLLLESAYWDMQGQYDGASDSFRNAMFEACYLVGFCYSELHQYARAGYYLQVTEGLHRVKYTAEYINTLVNAGDFRSMPTIDGLIRQIDEQQTENDGDEMPAYLRNFKSFLRRRKAFIHIEKRQLNEAKAILNAMLDEPECRDFAIKELAYIQKLEKQE